MSIRLVVASLLLSAGSALAYVPPTDEQVTALITKVTEIKMPADAAGQQAAAKARADALREGLAAISLSETTLPQIEKLAISGILSGNGVALKELAPRLAELAKAPTVEGARAAEIGLGMQPPVVAGPPAGDTKADRDRAIAAANEARVAAMYSLYREALNHPGVVDLVKSGKGDYLIRLFAQLPPEVIKQNGLLPAMERLLVPEMSLDAVAAFGAVVVKVSMPEVVADKAERVRWLDKVAAVGQGVIDRTGAVPAERETMLRRARETVTRAKSAFARGELIDGPAPELGFSWSSDGQLKSLSELKGSVVVLEFWATSSAPCAATFPETRKIVERYEAAGSPVRVVGVTGLLGYHSKRKPEAPGQVVERISCKGDAAKEYGLMAEFVKDMKMNWTVAFSPDGFANPNFGVVGIPHVTIIDAAGKVRHNGLHPSNPKGIADKIDALLKEANLKAPGEPMPEPEGAKKVG